ncbi:hypothetical protein GGR51DRAFT_553087 [Nemania sp. FL0031]|nr:hypothetical protein GGR51DRAFT_553087 [Nemania sp. FL0031]
MDVDVAGDGDGDGEGDVDVNKSTAAPDATATTTMSGDANSERPGPSTQPERDATTDASAKATTEADADVDANIEAEAEAEADTEADAAADGEAEADGEADGEVDGDGDGDDGEPEDRLTPNRLDNDMLTVIENVANYLTAYKDPDGYNIAAHFQRVPNRRLLPDYYEIIKEPTAFSTIRIKKLKKQYTTFPEFVRDVALISHNAQVYNRPSSQVFKDALRLREIFQEELQKLIDDETITPEEAILPDLGEIPEADESPDEDEDEVMDEDEDDEDDEDEDDEESSDDDDDDSRGRRRRRGRGGRKSDSRIGESQKRRGRPPKVFTPVEARIYSLLQGLRKLKHPDGNLLIYPFEKLPDKASNPDYYTTISNPIALDIIKRKYKRKKYQSVDQAMQDIDLMFENAKEYNIESSQLYKDAVQLQNHARELAEHGKTRPDNDFEDENGRRPVAEIHHRGEIWRVGDWVHITNANDLTKPIIAQIYRTWQDRQGQQWVNACWYYRPEQTVHRHDKFFLENEVVKTGQYRDHRIDEVVDRCFVMFVTRFDKGRPRGFPRDKEVYVCKSRYNEENHRLNKIKTWTSCLPDEVREKDYQMDLFDVPRQLKKIPSPIKHLLRYEAKPTDPLPKPTWGAPNAPPLVGAVHCRERESNESPPPEPTPVPAHVDPIRHPSMMQVPRPRDSQGDINMGNTGHFSTIPPQPAPANGHGAPAYPTHYAPRPSATPVPVPQYGTHTFQAAHVPPPQMTTQAPQYQPHPPHQTHHTPAFNGYSPHPSQYNPTPVPMPPQPHHPPPHQMANPIVPYDPSQRLAPSPARNSVVPVPSPGGHLQANAYNPPRPIEVYRLDDATNDSIPGDVREQFLQDESGNVLFFTQPPLGRAHRGVSTESADLGHSVRYLADRAREVQDRRAKRKARDEMRKEEERKRSVLEQEAVQIEKQEQVDSAAKILLGWAQSIQDEADVLQSSYKGWSVKDKEIDAVQN